MDEVLDQRLASHISFCSTSDFYNSIINEPDHKRKPNFSEPEKAYLVEQYAVFKDILTAKGADGKSIRRKNEIWNFIATGLRQFNPTVIRTVKEVRKKWENLTVLARKEMAEHKLNPSVVAPVALSLKILELIDDIVVSPQVVSDQESEDADEMEQSLPVVKNERYESSSSTNPIEPDEGHPLVSYVSGVQASSNGKDRSNGALLPGCSKETTQNSDDIATTPAAENHVPKIASCFSLKNRKESNPNYTPNTFDLLRPPNFPPAAEWLSGAALQQQSRKRPFETTSFHDDDAEEIFIKNLRRRKIALEVERMELENNKLKLEIKMLQLRVEKERRSLE